MPRFSKGTTDHDHDGRMGGSMPGDKTMAKKPAAKKAARKPAAKKGMDVQSGMAPGKDKDAAKAETAAMFAEADAKGDAASDPTPEQLEEIRVGLQVRGY